MRKPKLCQATKNGQYYVCDCYGWEWPTRTQHNQECPGRQPPEPET